MKPVVFIECDQVLHATHVRGFTKAVQPRLVGTDLEDAVIVILPQGWRTYITDPDQASITLSRLLAETDCRGHMATLKTAVEEWLDEFHAGRDRDAGAVRLGEVDAESDGLDPGSGEDSPGPGSDAGPHPAD